MKKKRKIYNYISDLTLLERTPNWPLDDEVEDRALYSLGHIKIPRSMLLSAKFQDLKPTSKSVYLYLMAKEEIIRKKRKAWIDDTETAQNKGIITASKREIAKYTGIRSDNLKASMDELQTASLLKKIQVIDDAKIVAPAWQIAHWPIDKMGYVKMPLAVMISPAWLNITHETRILYIVLLSEHCSQKKKQGTIFPEFTLTYSQIRSKYGLCTDTIRGKSGEDGRVRSGIKALENTGLITCEHGKFIIEKDVNHPDDPKKNHVTQDLNKYWISTDFMYESQEKDNDN